MKNFLQKEIKLCLNPINYIFLLFISMLIIPNYPCYVPFFYICLSVFFIFNNGLLNKDVQYSLILPIKKGDIVKSRCILVCVYQLVAIILSIPFAVLRYVVLKTPNAAGIEANVAFYGLCMIALSVFNYFFFTKYYKKIDKLGLPFFIASMSYLLCYFIFEIPVWLKDILNINYFKILDSVAPSDLLKQLPVLAFGILIYFLSWILINKKTSNIFEKVDL